MAKENENQVLREYGNRKKRYKRIRRIIVVTLLLAAVLVGIIYMAVLFNRSYKSYKVMKSTEIDGESASGYLSFGSSVIKYGKDGVIAYDKSGDQLWNSSYDMSDPITDICDKYVVIADRGGTSVHIFNNTGEVGSYSTAYDITKVEVAYQGVAAVLMEDGENNHIILYDTDGTNLGEIGNNVNDTGYPMDISLSNDGTKLVTIYMSVTTGELVSNVVCYNFDDVGDNTNNCVGGYKFDKGIVAPKVAFVNNDTFCVYKDNGFAIYSMKELPSDINEINLKGNILSILYNKSCTGVVLQSEDGSEKHLMLYNLKGKLILDKPIDFNYKKIFLTDKEIIMHNNLSCIILRMNGKQKFKDTFKTDISGVYPINNLDRYYLIDETKLSDIQLKD